MVPAPPVADRLRRIAALRLARPLREVSDPAAAAEVAVALGGIADPPFVDDADVAALAAALSGAAGLTPVAADRLLAGLGLPAGALDPGSGFDAVEDGLVRAFLDARGVAGVLGCRGGRGRDALLALVGVVDRHAEPPGCGAA